MASKLAVICYGFGDLASQFVWTFVGSYLTIYYTDIVGLAPAIVSVIMMGARIWDAINDPMMGAIAERTRSKFGRFRPYIAFGCPFLAIFAVLTFTNPFGGGSAAGAIWAAVTYIIAGMLYTLVNIPYAALSGVMTEDANQRNKINTSRNIGMNLGMVIVNALSAGLALRFSGEGAEVANGHGYMMTALIYAIISIPLFLIVFATAKEKVQPMHGTQAFSFKDTVNNLVRNKYLMIITLIMLLQMTAFMGRIAVTSYYVIYCLGSFTMIALIMTIPSLGGIIGSFFVPFFAKRFGKRAVLMGSMLIQAVGLLVIYFAPFDNITMVLVGCWIFGLFNVGFPMTLSMVADSVDYMELKTGIRTDGTAYATYGLATKVGNAIGGSIGVLLLAAFGYVANAEQTVEAMNGINIVVNLIPAILFILGAAACLLWDMSDKDADEIREKLKAKNNQTQETV
ncbi:sugar (glycoside-pentoside-Hexuronide) transporter [Butyricicoccus pullicaecorum]|uniref:Sugar (Glycoside-pentoside-Hexuronide) transporter n=2 Tax=Butyricicoccus pullicaecorum TaxID=501571 RepID=A0A1Y4LHA1_9FIRM|nr:sugar (glycoside-pentoside-Hexuronide) transporter [Butyricicoccus pullicaecorum]OUP56891.1 sugar (glycoside-pentoside-Hexuronide) transporter [Butyricicoccus pullicaecorum]